MKFALLATLAFAVATAADDEKHEPLIYSLKGNLTGVDGGPRYQHEDEYWKYECHTAWKNASYDIITKSEATALQGMNVEPAVNRPGPMNCGRLRCANGSSITWCNDNPWGFVAGKISDIGDAAMKLCETCSDDEKKECGGQIWNKAANWNVVVRNEECHSPQ